MKYNDIFWMNKAYKLALNSKKEIPVGSILIFKNKIISKSCNKIIETNDPTAHAEIIVLRKAGIVLKKSYLFNTTLYVTLEPCIMCIGAILNSRIKRLVYGTSCNKIGSVIFFKNIINNSNFKNKIKITSGILINKCTKILKNFFKK
ncbi:MAG: tRNA adenosine(34) deaminase TadA [Enterobacteriaceae bacterium]